MAHVRFVDVSKRYGDGQEAIFHLDLDIADGEFVVLVGPSVRQRQEHRAADAGRIGGHHRGRDGGLRFGAIVDTVESTGADLYVHARVEAGAPADSRRVEDLLPDHAGRTTSRARDGAPRLVARLDPATRARPGTRLMLRADADRICVFDAATGTALAGASRDTSRALGARRRQERVSARRDAPSGP